MNMEKLKEFYEKNKMLVKPLAIVLFICVLIFYGENTNAQPNEDEPNAATMRVTLEKDGSSQVIMFQCNDLSECAERLSDKLQSNEGSCDPRIQSILLEKTYIEGM